MEIRNFYFNELRRSIDVHGSNTNDVCDIWQLFWLLQRLFGNYLRNFNAKKALKNLELCKGMIQFESE